MYRWDARTITSLFIFISWLIPFYLLIETYTKSRILQTEHVELKNEMDNLRANYELLSNSIIIQKSHGDVNISSNTLVNSNSELIDGRRQVNGRRNKVQRLINIFIETDFSFLEQNKTPANDYQQQTTSTSTNTNTKTIKRQFFKTFGTTGNDGILFDNVRKLPEHLRKRVLVTGGAGFVGSHLVDSLMLDGHEVIVCDNFYTGRKSNIEHWQGHPNFEIINHDIINPLTIEVDQIYHLASPASPVHYMANPIKTIKTNTLGTINMLGLAKRVGARILIASTSEIYGDPEVHPQSEAYWGNANTVGPRSCYDESKRLSESLAVAYNKRENVSIGIARIFNTYGPRMHPNDGRVVSNFIMQALNNESLTVYGSGAQTRSFQYISDLIVGLKKLMDSQVDTPVNLGNPDEMTIYSLAYQIKSILRYSTSNITFNKLPQDDPHRRKPNVDKARQLLNWQPKVTLLFGLQRTIEYFAQEIS